MKLASLVVVKMKLQTLRSNSTPSFAIVNISNYPFHHFSRAILLYSCNHKHTISEVLSNQVLNFNPPGFSAITNWIFFTIFMTRRSPFGDFLLTMLFQFIKKTKCLCTRDQIWYQSTVLSFYSWSRRLFLHWIRCINLS